MRHLVVDASVVAKWYFNEPGSNVALGLLEKATEMDCRLVAPDLLLYEVGNIVRKRVRSKMISRETGEDLLHSLASAPIELVHPDTLILLALEVSYTADVTLYDATYVALADGLKTTVITADERLIQACGSTAWQSRVTLLGEPWLPTIS